MPGYRNLPPCMLDLNHNVEIFPVGRQISLANLLCPWCYRRFCLECYQRRNQRTAATWETPNSRENLIRQNLNPRKRNRLTNRHAAHRQRRSRVINEVSVVENPGDLYLQENAIERRLKEEREADGKSRSSSSDQRSSNNSGRPGSRNLVQRKLQLKKPALKGNDRLKTLAAHSRRTFTRNPRYIFRNQP